MMRAVFTLYTPKFVRVLVYMLQTSDYRVAHYVRWLMRVKNVNNIMYRGTVRWTVKARLLFALGILSYCLLLLTAVGLYAKQAYIAAFMVVISMPLLLVLFLAFVAWLGYAFIQKPQVKILTEQTKKAIKQHQGIKIAVAGSYGKTTMKELLNTVLDSKLHVAASPGNMNTAIGLSRFMSKLDGSEDVLIFELGEEKVGDVKRLCDLTIPNYGVITGIAEAHLETFKSMQQVVSTIFELQAYVGVDNTYINAESDNLPNGAAAHTQAYSARGVNGWKVKNVSLSFDATVFTVSKGKASIAVKSALLGAHQIGPLCACIDIAYRLGMTPQEIEQGLAQVVPFEHRMQPRHINGGLVIDDTYNGNSKGVESGLALLKTATAKRKIYVTPGLVEQGEQTHAIHQKIGTLIAGVADMVVLMNNSTTADIAHGLQQAGFTGEIMYVDDPLEFYQNLRHFMVAGDVVLMQNDWTDNYA